MKSSSATSITENSKLGGGGEGQAKGNSMKRLMEESSPKGKSVSRQYNHKRQDGLDMLIPVRIPAICESPGAANSKIQPNTTSSNSKKVCMMSRPFWQNCGIHVLNQRSFPFTTLITYFI